MALLRVADYLQLQASRAPLQQLKFIHKLLSPFSKREWNTHLAVDQIVLGAIDPEAVEIRARPDNVDVFLRLRQNLKGLQEELDRCWGVLGEVYGRHHESHELGIIIRRVRSNFDDPRNESSLSFVARHAAFSAADSDLLKLLINPLYGNSPYVGVRELLQNAVDAVRERRDLVGIQEIGPVHDNSEAEVNVELSRNVATGEDVFIIRDFGIGMTPETICRYFLRAGASLRASDNWRQQHADIDGKSRVCRSGRFGVGVLAAFLLGSQIEVRTRHVRSQKGCHFFADIDTDPISLSYFEDPTFEVGTEIKIVLEKDASKRLREHITGWDWYVLSEPRVSRKVDGVLAKQSVLVPSEVSNGDDKWHRIDVKGYGPIFWSSEESPGLACNGIHVIDKRAKLRTHGGVVWEHPLLRVETPSLSVFDPDGRLPLTLLRNQLDGQLEFNSELFCDIWRHEIAKVASTIAREQRHSRNGATISHLFKAIKSSSRVQSREMESPWCVLDGRYLIPADHGIFCRYRAKRIIASEIFLSRGLAECISEDGTIIVWIRDNAIIGTTEAVAPQLVGETLDQIGVHGLIPIIDRERMQLLIAADAKAQDCVVRKTDQFISFAMTDATFKEIVRRSADDIKRYQSDATTKRTKGVTPTALEAAIRPREAPTSELELAWDKLALQPIPLDRHQLQGWINSLASPFHSLVKHYLESGKK